MILLVEDNEQVRELFRTALSQAGFEVAEASTGQAAIEMLKRGRYALALVDLSLPDIHGLTVARCAKEGGCGTPMIAVSGVAELIDPAILSSDFEQTVAKPLRLSALVDLVRSYEAAPTGGQK
jgi:CheY-like chemotaxis protein